MPMYDNWSAAFLLPFQGGTTGIDNSTNTTETGEPTLAPGGAGKTLWVKFVPEDNGIWRFTGTTPVPKFRTALDVYEMGPGGTGIADLVHLGGDVSTSVSDSSNVEVELVIGESYWIRFDSVDSPGGNAGLSWTQLTSTPPPGGWGVGMVRMGAN